MVSPLLTSLSCFTLTPLLGASGQLISCSEVPRSKRKLRGDRAFSVAAPKLWNDLPLHIRQASSLSIFKTNLKTHFYSLAFDPAWDFAPVLLFLLFFTVLWSILCFMIIMFYDYLCTALCFQLWLFLKCFINKVELSTVACRPNYKFSSACYINVLL